jgi:hypothetical protein
MRGGKQPRVGLYFYSPILDSTRIWRVGEWLSAPLCIPTTPLERTQHHHITAVFTFGGSGPAITAHGHEFSPSMRGGKQPRVGLYFYSPILDSTRIWRVGEWLYTNLQNKSQYQLYPLVYTFRPNKHSNFYKTVNILRAIHWIFLNFKTTEL